MYEELLLWAIYQIIKSPEKHSFDSNTYSSLHPVGNPAQSHLKWLEDRVAQTKVVVICMSVPLSGQSYNVHNLVLCYGGSTLQATAKLTPPCFIQDLFKWDRACDGFVAFQIIISRPPLVLPMHRKTCSINFTTRNRRNRNRHIIRRSIHTVQADEQGSAHLYGKSLETGMVGLKSFGSSSWMCGKMSLYVDRMVTSATPVTSAMSFGAR